MRVAPATGMSVTGKAFQDEVTKMIISLKPRRIIETGTYLGLGTTSIIAGALEWCQSYTMFTIEANPYSYNEACANLRQFPDVRPQLGYSIPHSLIPTKEEIITWLDLMSSQDIYVDFQDAERVACYCSESLHVVPYDLINVCLRFFGYQADLIMLDSAGHLGFKEFTYVLRLLQSPCTFVLDDTNHVKHWQSLRFMKDDCRFKILVESDEKFGFCIAEYKPSK